MKYVILLGDGMADYPLDDLGGKTPLEYAHTPFMDTIASRGTIGLIDTIPAGYTPGSDVANLSVLGYDPTIYFTGRGPLEAASMHVKLGSNDVAFRCNLVTLGHGDDAPVMEDFSAGHITSDEAGKIIADLNMQLGSDSIRFYPGVGYRHLMVWKGGSAVVTTTPPHDIVGQKTGDYLPAGFGADEVIQLMHDSEALLQNHPVNLTRRSAGKKPATSIWLWGQGGAPDMDHLTKKYNLEGGMISAVDLLNGIGVYAGLDILPVQGATGYTDTNYEGKATKALEYLDRGDFVFVHVEAPDEMGHEGNIEGKIKALEDFDRKIVGPILEGLQKFKDFRLLVLSDHPTPISIRTHVSDPSPFAVYSSRPAENRRSGLPYSETAARQTGLLVSPGHLLMNHFITEWGTFIDEKRD